MIFLLLYVLPGKPDPPQHCSPDHVADNDVTLKCILGYTGGEDIEFYVERQDGGKRRKVRNLGPLFQCCSHAHIKIILKDKMVEKVIRKVIEVSLFLILV